MAVNEQDKVEMVLLQVPIYDSMAQEMMTSQDRRELERRRGELVLLSGQESRKEGSKNEEDPLAKSLSCPDILSKTHKP